jgi:hypothetical protein
VSHTPKRVEAPGRDNQGHESGVGCYGNIYSSDINTSDARAIALTEARKRKAIAAIARAYAIKYKPRTRYQVVKYICRRGEYRNGDNYPLIASVVNALYLLDELPGVVG